MIKWKVVSRSKKSMFARGKYSIDYDYAPGMVVSAPPDTIGIMVFGRKTDALHFAGTVLFPYHIVKVKPIGRGKKPEKVSWTIDEKGLDAFYQATDDSVGTCPPKGTICYPAVEVV